MGRHVLMTGVWAKQAKRHQLTEKCLYGGSLHSGTAIEVKGVTCQHSDMISHNNFKEFDTYSRRKFLESLGLKFYTDAVFENPPENSGNEKTKVQQPVSQQKEQKR